MKVSFFIAKRYFFAKKTRLVNLISGISVISIAVGTASLMIVLSVFNGLDSLIKSMFNTMDPDLVVEARHNLTFSDGDIHLSDIQALNGVDCFAYTLEENALIRHRSNQMVVTLKGVAPGYEKMIQLEKAISLGTSMLDKGEDNHFAVVGYGIYANLRMQVPDLENTTTVYVPKRGKYVSLQPEEAFRSAQIMVSGVFSSVAEYDNRYVLLPLALTQQLTEDAHRVSKLEIRLKEQANVRMVKQELSNLLGEHFVVKDRYQQQEMTYKTVNSERLSIILILSFILLISTFNMVSSLMMMIYDKRKDIRILKSMGANLRHIRSIFLMEGLMISMVGGFLGLILGGLVSLLQQTFGFIKLQQDTAGFVVDAYPVELRSGDFLMVMAIVLCIGLLSALIPVLRIKRAV